MRYFTLAPFIFFAAGCVPGEQGDYTVEAVADGQCNEVTVTTETLPDTAIAFVEDGYKLGIEEVTEHGRLNFMMYLYRGVSATPPPGEWPNSFVMATTVDSHGNLKPLPGWRAEEFDDGWAYLSVGGDRASRGTVRVLDLDDDSISIELVDFRVVTRECIKTYTFRFPNLPLKK